MVPSRPMQEGQRIIELENANPFLSSHLFIKCLVPKNRLTGTRRVRQILHSSVSRSLRQWPDNDVVKTEGSSFSLPLSASCLLSLPCCKQSLPQHSQWNELSHLLQPDTEPTTLILQGLQKQVQLRKLIFP